MAASRPHTLATLEGSLLRLLRAPDTTLRLRELRANEQAQSGWHRNGRGDPRNLWVVVDSDRVGLVEGVLHELMHAHLGLERILTRTLTEVAITALARIVHERIDTHPPSLARWRRAIQKKLDEAAP